MFFLHLPARTPEWNPIEKIMNILVRQLGLVSLAEFYELGSDCVGKAAGILLNKMSFEMVSN